MAGPFVKAVGGPGSLIPTAVGATRLLAEHARIQGGAGNLDLQARVARETQRDRDLFTATRERSRAGEPIVDRPMPAAATGDHQRPPRRSWLDLFRLRRRRPR